MADRLVSIVDVEAMLDHPGLEARRLHRIWAARQPVLKSIPRDGGSPSVSVTDEGPIPWLQESVEMPRLFVRRAIDAGEFLLACDVAREALRFYRNDVELQQSLAQALVRLGSIDEARTILGRLEARRALTARALCRNLCLLGDTFLDEALATEVREEREAALRSALSAYQRASRR